MTIPTYLPYFVFAGTAATVVAILYGLNRALADAAWPAADRTRVLRVSAVVLLGWLALSIALAAMGVYHVDASAIPTIQYGIVLPILIGSLLIWRSETVARILDAVPQQWLVGVQLYRALGVIFLILYASRQAARPLRLAGRRWRHRHRPARSGRRPRLCASAARCGGSRPGLERVRHLGSRRRGHDRLHDRAVAHPADRGPAQQRTDDGAADGVDPGLSGAAVDRAARRLVGEAAPRDGAERQQGRERFSLTAACIRQAASRLSTSAGPLPYCSSDAVSGVAGGCGLEII